MRVTTLRYGSILRVGVKAILRNKLRSILTMLGIIIGVGCIIAMNAVASGASASVRSTIESLGTNFMIIFPGAVTQSGARIFSGQSTITPEDVEAIREELPSVAYVSAGLRTASQVVAGEFNWGTTVYGVDVDWPFIRAWNMGEGDFFTESDVKGSARVCVLGATVADNLFPEGGAAGRTVRIKNVPFRVAGVLERKGGNLMGQDQDDQIVAPYTTIMKRVSGSTRLGSIYAAAAPEAGVEQATADITALLRQRHRLGPGQDSDFAIRTQQEIAATAAQTSRTFSILLGSVAAISLLVGGIGIMNIMLVSVTERTREIGVRMAIGAKPRHVLAQFLIEAVILSVAGGALGIGVGMLTSTLVSRLAGWPTLTSGTDIALAFGFAAAIGIFFGFYPARKASRLDPIEALRYE